MRRRRVATAPSRHVGDSALDLAPEWVLASAVTRGPSSVRQLWHMHAAAPGTAHKAKTTKTATISSTFGKRPRGCDAQDREHEHERERSAFGLTPFDDDGAVTALLARKPAVARSRGGLQQALALLDGFELVPRAGGAPAWQPWARDRRV
jgi:hypothetical protein